VLGVRTLAVPPQERATASTQGVRYCPFGGVVTSTADRITEVCDELRDMLIAKNRAYGDSATDPVRIFSKADPQEQILVRLDDKLSRVARGSEYSGDDTIMDLLGYLVLLRVTRTTSTSPVALAHGDGRV